MSETALRVVGRDEFRRRLAGLADPGRAVQDTEIEAFRALSRDLVISLCLVFGRDLDRKTLWSRIDSALQAACAKVDDGDTDRWIDLLLEHVKADASHVVRTGLLQSVRSSLDSRDETHRRAFVRWVEARRFAVLTAGRKGWDEWKQTHAQPKNGEASEEVGDE